MHDEATKILIESFAGMGILFTLSFLIGMVTATTGKGFKLSGTVDEILFVWFVIGVVCTYTSVTGVLPGIGVAGVLLGLIGLSAYIPATFIGGTFGSAVVRRFKAE